MKIGTRKYGAATCEVRFAEGVPDHMKHDVRLLTDLYTEEQSRGFGHATELLNRLFIEADRFKVILIVNPEPYGNPPMIKEQLIEWYASFGFNEIQAEPLLMARMFNIPQVVDAASQVSNLIIEAAK